MKFRFHLLVVAAMVLPFELNHWLRTHQVLVNADIVSNQIVKQPRARSRPVVLLEVTFTLKGRAYSDELRLMEPADNNYNWTTGEQLAAERFVSAHRAGGTVRVWVPWLIPCDGATLAIDGFQPTQLRRTTGYLAFVGALLTYLALVLAVQRNRRKRRAGNPAARVD